MIGYGPEPEKEISFCQTKKIDCILGSHVLPIFDNDELDSFNQDAYNSILLTIKVISINTFDYIKKLLQTLIKKILLLSVLL